VTKANVAVVVGTRPEVIKMAPLVIALRESEHLNPVLISTGQHRQMLDQALAVFGLTPDIDLQLMEPGQGLSRIAARTLETITKVYEDIQPAWVAVQGDTTTAMAAGLAAFNLRIPVAHVEAGLRSGRRYSPFPEEINRKIIDQFAELLFAPTADAAAKLFDEGLSLDSVYVTGNTVVDALLAIRAKLRANPVAIPGLDPARVAGKRIMLVTAHRRESHGDGLKEICEAVKQIVRDHEDVVAVYPVHMNPNVDGPARQLLGGNDRIVLLPPLDYLAFTSLLDMSYLVLTDSGGVQEEAPTFKKPILVLRSVTERPEGVDAGVARLVGTSARVIYSEATRLLRDPKAYAAMTSSVNPYGDGTAAQQIVRHLERGFVAKKKAA
jgi:UDP-N-acetylglucosamine 2-epimerase (non-hydrolysing)